MQPELLDRRAATIGVDGQKIRGYAIVFDTPSMDLGGFSDFATTG